MIEAFTDRKESKTKMGLGAGTECRKNNMNKDMKQQLTTRV